MWTALTCLAAGGVASMLLTPAARHLSARTGIVARPVADRWHRLPVGKLGGISMLVALTAVGAAIPGVEALWPLLLTTVLMVGVGFWDDLWPVSPATKLLGQLLVAALLLYLLPPVAITGHVILDYGLKFFWLVGLTNAFNLLDNIDGLAAGVAAIAAAFLTATLLSDPVAALHPLTLLLATFTGVVVGFLWFNFFPATIFMGDSGSHLIGFFISGAVLTALPSLPAGTILPSVTGTVVILLVPIFDTAFVTITRGMAGRSVFSGGRDHTSHRLVAVGISERQAVLVLYALAIVGGGIGWGLHEDQARFAWGLMALYVAALVTFGIYLGHTDGALDDPTATAPLPTELTTRYRAYEVTLDAILIGVAYYLALGIRFAEPEFSNFLPYFAQSLPLVLALQLLGLAVAGKYRQNWRSFGAEEIRSLFAGIAMGSGATVLAVLYLYRFQGFSRAVFVFDAVLLALMLLGSRALLGAVDDYLQRTRSRGRQTLILGAGRAGALAVQKLLQNPQLGLVPGAFLDDDPAKHGQRIGGVRVLGSIASLTEHLDHNPGEFASVVIAVSDLPHDVVATVLAECDARNIPVQRMRVLLEDAEWRHRGPGIVKFPGRGRS